MIKIQTDDGFSRNTRVFVDEKEITDYVSSIELSCIAGEFWEGQIIMFTPKIDVSFPLDNTEFRVYTWEKEDENTE